MTIRSTMFVVLIATSLISIASAVPGTATFNTIYVPSACYGYQDPGSMIVAANAGLYSNGAACGRTCTVTCTGGTNAGVLQPCTGAQVTVTIVDLCPGCTADQLDLSEQAFTTIANPDAGKILIDYNCS